MAELRDAGEFWSRLSSKEKIGIGVGVGAIIAVFLYLRYRAGRNAAPPLTYAAPPVSGLPVSGGPSTGSFSNVPGVADTSATTNQLTDALAAVTASNQAVASALYNLPSTASATPAATAFAPPATTPSPPSPASVTINVAAPNVSAPPSVAATAANGPSVPATHHGLAAVSHHPVTRPVTHPVTHHPVTHHRHPPPPATTSYNYPSSAAFSGRAPVPAPLPATLTYPSSAAYEGRAPAPAATPLYTKPGLLSPGRGRRIS